jgi:hypothetical protein
LQSLRSNPNLHPDDMLAAASGLTVTGNGLVNGSGEVGGAVARTGCEGPFFSDMTVRVERIADKLRMGGTGLRAVAARLERDAQEQRVLREWDIRHQPELKPGPG